MTTPPSPTTAELEILQILWQLGPAKVQQVNDVQNESRAVGYTSTLKTMQIMEQKGLLGRNKDGKSHIYFPLIEQQKTQTSLLDKLVQGVFGGSRSQLVMQLLGNQQTSKEELKEIKDFLRKLEQKQDGAEK